MTIEEYLIDIMDDPEKPSLTAPSKDTAKLNEPLKRSLIKSKELTELRDDSVKNCDKLKKSNLDQDKLLKDNTMMKKSLKTYEETITELKRTMSKRENELNELRKTANGDQSTGMISTKIEHIVKDKFEHIEKSITLQVNKNNQEILNQVKENNRKLQEKLNEVVNQNKTYANCVKNIGTVTEELPKQVNAIDT